MLQWTITLILASTMKDFFQMKTKIMIYHFLSHLMATTIKVVNSSPVIKLQLYCNNILGIRDRTASGSLCRPRSRCTQLLEHSVFFDLNEDETDIKVAPRLLQLQFPCVDEGMCIMRKPNSATQNMHVSSLLF